MSDLPAKPKRKRVVTPAMIEANRANSRLPRPGGRKPKPMGEEERLLVNGLARLRSAVPEAVELLVSAMRGTLRYIDHATGKEVELYVESKVRVQAAGQLLDRAGLPRRTEIALAASEAVGRVLIDIRGDLKAPPNWNGEATVEGPPVH